MQDIIRLAAITNQQRSKIEQVKNDLIHAVHNEHIFDAYARYGELLEARCVVGIPMSDKEWEDHSRNIRSLIESKRAALLSETGVTVRDIGRAVHSGIFDFNFEEALWFLTNLSDLQFVLDGLEHLGVDSSVDDKQPANDEIRLYLVSLFQNLPQRWPSRITCLMTPERHWWWFFTSRRQRYSPGMRRREG